MKQNSILKEALTDIKTVAIAGHVRPDGDCVGSCMGVYQYIKRYYPAIHADVYLEEIPNIFKFISATSDIKHEVGEVISYDLFIVLDCGSKDRLGFTEILFEQAEQTLCIDHHVSNTSFADVNYVVSDASSTCELVYHLIGKECIDQGIAECLYLGIIHDTGVFQYSSTSPETLEVAAELMRTGMNAAEIIQSTYYEKSYTQQEVLGRALVKSELLLNGRCIVSTLSKEELSFYRVGAKHLEGIVSQLRNTKGVEVAIFIYQLEDGEHKVSLRSKNDVDVSLIAQKFGGGGHKKAAGLSMNKTVRWIIDELIGQIEVQL